MAAAEGSAARVRTAFEAAPLLSRENDGGVRGELSLRYLMCLVCAGFFVFALMRFVAPCFLTVQPPCVALLCVRLTKLVSGTARDKVCMLVSGCVGTVAPACDSTVVLSRG